MPIRSLTMIHRRPSRNARAAAACSLFAVLFAGCSNNGNRLTDRPAGVGGGGATPQVFRNTTMDAVMDATTIVLRDQFGGARVAAGSGVVTAGPASYTQRGGTERVSDATLRPSYQMRRSATVWLAQEDGAIRAHCQVRVQRLDTTDYRSLRTHNEFNDLPTATPIDRDAGLSADQREVWTDLPRDSAMERQVLGAIHRRLHGLSDEITGEPADSPDTIEP